MFLKTDDKGYDTGSKVVYFFLIPFSSQCQLRCAPQMEMEVTWRLDFTMALLVVGF